MSQTIRDGCLSRKICAPKPSLPVAPGARFWTKTSALSIMRASTSLAPSCLRSRVRDSLERLSQTKWLARPFTVLSYPRAKSPTSGRSTGEAQAQPTVFLRDERAEVATLRHCLDKGFRVLPSRVELAPVAVGEVRAHLADSSPQVLVLVGAPHVTPPAAGFARRAPDPGSRRDR